MDADTTTNRQESTAVLWQGANWRRLCRALTGFLLFAAIGYSLLDGAPSGTQALAILAVIAIAFALSEWLFARRVGFEVGDEGITLRGALSRVFVPWSRVSGLRWEQSRRLVSRTRFLYLETDQAEPRRVPADAPLRIPTVACATHSSLPNDRLLGPILSSPNVRSVDGREADALDLLEKARADPSR